MKTDLMPVGTAGRKPIFTPTDLAQYIRLDQCQRFLRLQLHTRNGGSHFWRDHGIAPQPIAPHLSVACAEFEGEVEAGFGPHFEHSDLAPATPNRRQRPPDNERVLREITNLSPGETKIILQPRLSIGIGDWQLRGDLDILRLHRSAEGVLQILIADIKRSTSAMD